MKNCRQIRFVKRCTLYGGVWNLFCRAGHDPRVRNLLWSIRRRTRLAIPKTICAPDSSSLKPSSGATEGVLDYGVLGYPNYMHVPDCWAMKIQGRRLRPVSRWDSPLRGRQAWQFEYVDSLLCNRLCVTLAPSGVYINRRV